MADKFEREIEEILNKLDRFPAQRHGFRVRRVLSKSAVSFQRTLAMRLVRLSVSQIMLTGIAMILFGYFFRAALQPIWYYVVILGLILFFTSFVLSLFSGKSPSGGRQVYWRGRPAQSYYSSGPSLGARLRDWWRRRQNKR